jgi:hypothetical protein
MSFFTSLKIDASWTFDLDPVLDFIRIKIAILGASKAPDYESIVYWRYWKYQLCL